MLRALPVGAPHGARRSRRAENGGIVALKTRSADCDVDAGGMPVVWLTDVKPDESVAWLTSLIGPPPAGARSHIAQAALVAIALHETRRPSGR